MDNAILVSSYTPRNIYLVYKLHHKLNIGQPIVNALSVYQRGWKKKSQEIFIDSLSSQNRETSYGHERKREKKTKKKNTGDRSAAPIVQSNSMPPGSFIFVGLSRASDHHRWSHCPRGSRIHHRHPRHPPSHQWKSWNSR